MHRLRRIALALLCLTLLSTPPMAGAQETAGGTPADALSPEQARAVSDLLKDDQVRGALIGELDRIAASAEEAPPAEAKPQETVSLGRRIARSTQETAEAIAGSAARFWGHLQNVPRTLDNISSVSPQVLLDAIGDLALVIFSTVLLYVLLRRLAKTLYRRMGRIAHGAGAGATFLLMLGSIVIDAIVVLAAWGAGYALALLVFGSLGEVGIRQSLYLNAFLIVEMVKVLLRAVVSPVTSDLRPVNITDHAARVLARVGGFVTSLLGYGQLLVVPIINKNVSSAAGYGVSTLISVLAILCVIATVWRYRKGVANWAQGESPRRGFLGLAARYWHVPVLLYLLGVLAIVLARPGGVLFPVLGASAKIAGAFIVGLIVASVLGRAIQRGISLPERVNERLPLLERRLNAFVPRTLAILRLVIFLVVLTFAFHTLGFFDMQTWLESTIGVQLTGIVISIALILLFAFVLWLGFSSWIEFRLNPEFGSVATAREQTLLTLLRNAVTIILIVITTMFVLSEVGIDIAPLIASAGVLGLAIGFGAQKLVQDIITGVFIQLENAMNVGDVVTTGGTTGTVERLTIRSVSLRDVHGTYHIIPFSSVDMVSNFMRDYGHYVCDMGIAYHDDIGAAESAMKDAFAELVSDPAWAEKVMGDLTWFGLQSFGDSAVIVRARIKCRPGQQWAVGRAYNAIVKRIFDERGIDIPFPHQTLYFGEAKSGTAPAARVEILDRRSENTTDDPEAGGGSREIGSPTT